MYAAYRLMPNDTDLTLLKTTGVSALNFAFTETVRNYHSAEDTVANLDPRSLQQMGANTLALARHFGAGQFDPVRAPDDIYFNWFGWQLLHYPLWVGWALAALNLLLLALVFFRGQRGGAVRFGVVSLAAFPLLLLSLGGGMILFWKAGELIFRESLGRGDTSGNLLFFAFISILGFALGALLLRWLSRKVGAGSLSFGLLLLAALLSGLLLFLWPGASYVLQWPALLGAGALLLGLTGSSPVACAGWGLLAALPVILLLAPLAYFFMVNLGLNPFSLAATALLLSLLLAAGWPVFDFLLGERELSAVGAR